MIDEADARRYAQVNTGREFADARELREGWYFPNREPLIGSHGVIVNKGTGRVFSLGSAFSVERDLDLYDLGYQFERYDLVILAIRDLQETRRTIARLGLQLVEPTYEHGQVWRVPRTMTDLDIWARLEKLPCIFADVGLYFRIEHLVEARREGWFTFAALEYRPKR